MSMGSFDKFADDITEFFWGLHERRLKGGKNSPDFVQVEFHRLTSILIAKLPQPFLAELAAMPIEPDCGVIRKMLDSSPPGDRYQLTISDVEEGEEAGILSLCTSGVRTEVDLPLIRAWEARVRNEPLDVQEVVRWGFALGLVGLVMMQWIQESPMFQGTLQQSTLCVGIEDRVHLFLAFIEDGKLIAAAEWN